MSVAEIGYRVEQACVKQALKRGLFFCASPKVKAAKHMEVIPHPHERINAVPYLQEADAILNGEVILFADRKFNVGSPPDWNRDPLTGVLGPDSFGLAMAITNRVLVGDIKHVWELNRHLHLVRLAQAYALSGEQRFLDGLTRQLASWFEQCPALLGPNWSSSLEAGIRLINWSLIWQLVGGWDSTLFKGGAGEKLRDRWLDSVFAHCQFIRKHFSRHSSANNHLIGELSGLYVATRTWPYWDQCATWGSEAKRELEFEALLQHSIDGVNREQAFAYQIFTAEFLVIAGIYGHRTNDPFAEEFWCTLNKGLNFLRSVRDFGGHVPMVGDADDGVVLRLEPGEAIDRAEMMLAIGDAIFGRKVAGARSDTVRWLFGDADGLLRGKLPVAASDWKFPEGGYFIFGSDFGRATEVKGMVDCGPLGYLGIAAHGHADALALTLSVCGEECLVDPGTFSYWNELKWRNYFRGTSAHNTVMIDGQDQSVSGGRFMWTRKAKVTVDSFPVTLDRFDFEGSHDGYMRLPDPVRHTRRVNYVPSEKILSVTDKIAGIKGHCVEQFWHFAPDICVKLNSNVVEIVGRRFKINAEFFGDNLFLELVRGREQPPLGWFSRTYESKEPISTIRVFSSSSSVLIMAKFSIEILS